MRGWAASVAAIALMLSSSTLCAQRIEPAPRAIEGMDVREQLGASLPLDVVLRDERGREVPLSQYFAGDVPVLLTFNYSECPMLCQLQLQGLVDALRELDWTAGEQFRIVTVSIDPSETPQRAALAKQRYLQVYGREGAAAGWHFLTGDAAPVRRLADAAGFEYRYVAERGEYAHAAVLMACSPDGRPMRYVYGVEFPPQTLRLALLEAGEGKIGSTLDRVLLFCFHYDATAGRYGPAARRIMQLAGGVTVCIALVALVPYWIARRTSHVASRSEPQPDPTT